MTRGPTRWHYLGCALLSAVIGAGIGVGIVGFAPDSPEPSRRPPVREAVRVQPRLVSPADYAYRGFSLLLPRKLPRGAQPPPPGASCAEVHRWARQHGGEHVGRGRVLVRVAARRFAEVRVREVTVRTVASERPAEGVYLYCLPGRGDGDDDPLSCVPGYENSTSGCVAGPVFAAGRGSDVLLGHDYHVRTADESYRTLADLPFTLAEGESYELPVTVLSTRDVDASYLISVKLTVNGRRISRALGEDEPFRVRWQPHGIGFHPPSYTWREGESDRLEWDPGG